MILDHWVYKWVMDDARWPERGPEVDVERGGLSRPSMNANNLDQGVGKMIQRLQVLVSGGRSSPHLR